MLKEDSPDKELVPKGPQPMSVSAFWVKHNIKGDILIDTGLNNSFNKKPEGDYSLLMRVLSRMVGLEMKQEQGEGIESQIEHYRINPQMVFLTHLHGCCEQSRNPNNVSLMDSCCFSKTFWSNVCSQIDDFKSRSFQHHPYQVLTDIVKVAFNRPDDCLGYGLHTFLYQVWMQDL